MKSSLYTWIQDIQNGDREQALALLEKFSPLLKKYAFFLQSEDALPDFQCFLLAFAKNLQLDKLTMSTDGAIISYINKAIYHHYIALSKAKRHQLPTVSIESQTDYDPLQFDTAFSESDTYNNLLLLDLKRALSTEEYHIIYDHYFRQFSHVRAAPLELDAGVRYRLWLIILMRYRLLVASTVSRSISASLSLPETRKKSHTLPAPRP